MVLDSDEEMDNDIITVIEEISNDDENSTRRAESFWAFSQPTQQKSKSVEHEWEVSQSTQHKSESGK